MFDDDIQSDLDLIFRRLGASAVFRWAVVTAVSPVRIRFDGEAEPYALPPKMAGGPVQVGDRVFCVEQSRQVVVLGVAEPAGWVTSGLSITVGPGWSLSSYYLKRLGGRVTGSVRLNRTGAALTADSGANIPDQNSVITLPSGWGNSAPEAEYVLVWRSGYSTMSGRINAESGSVGLVGGSFPGHTIEQGDEWRFRFDHFCD